MSEPVAPHEKTLVGHPVGLFTLFFAEMWERFSFYGMRALLLFYMLKGFLHYGDHRAYAVYGSYTALVYMTPFFGGMLADRLLGARRAVVLGGLLMAAGHLVLTVQNDSAFYLALALLIAGNGFFKPNISTIVGSLYPANSPLRDGGFTLFYMGVNLGAALAPLLCGYIGETYGWHYGFGLATVGMLSGLATFVLPTRLAQGLIVLAALGTVTGLVVMRPDNAFSFGVNLLVGAALLASAGASAIALSRGGVPPEAGQPRDPALLAKKVGPLSREWLVYVGALVSLPVFALLVSGFSTFTADHQPVTLVSRDLVASLSHSSSALSQVFGLVAKEVSKPAGLVLTATGIFALTFLGRALTRLERIARERLIVVMVLMFFSMLFWSFFEQAGSSINNFTDRNVDRVTERRAISTAEVGHTVELSPTQEQIGYTNGGTLFTQQALDQLRAAHGEDPDFRVKWQVTADNVGMGVGERTDEVPASIFQATNPVFILLFGLVLTALWDALGKRGLEPSTPTKFALGLFQLSLGFAAIWYGAHTATPRGMVAVKWLVLGYLLHTTGELCLSPVGLSMVSRLSPPLLVSTVMGIWFLATAFSQYLAAIISQFTGAAEGDATPKVPMPKDTVMVYGSVFGKIAIASMIAALLCLALAPV
ncbi:MAG TPA: peptide MFS transporter, partial [Polyangiaceae bacterium]|nr:peptide MFS transporter [Polyangiaceae bacterium]